MSKKNKEIAIRSSAAEYLTFVAATGDDPATVEMRYEDENIWLTQKMMGVLYDVNVRTINEHLPNIFRDSELSEEAVIRKFRITASDGKKYDTKHYSLQAVIATGFKVNSARAVQFRKWVNQIAKDYTIQGWVMDVDRLKNGGSVLFSQKPRTPTGGAAFNQRFAIAGKTNYVSASTNSLHSSDRKPYAVQDHTVAQFPQLRGQSGGSRSRIAAP